MANTYTLIASNVLSTTAASVTFSSIPATYTDLVLRFSSRSDGASQTYSLLITLNALSSGYSETRLIGDGAAASSAASTGLANNLSISTGAGATSNTFSSNEIYLPSYTASQNKAYSIQGVTENNATTAFIRATAALLSNTAAINQITITMGSSTNFVSGSSFYLYGIKNS